MAVINGTSGADTLADTSGNDTINGLAGNDTINGGSGGSDVVNGGDGRDTLQFLSATSAMVVNFVAGTVTGGGSGTTSFTSIERMITGNFNDQITGDASAQSLGGRGGNDTLWGAGGNDTLWGQADADTFVFRETGTANADSIGDWTSGQDTLLLDGAVMTALGASGDFTAGDARFWASSAGTAHDADDRIIYETDTGQIWYDADGNGAGARQLIATLQTGATLVATDIAVEGSTSGGQVINGTSGDDSLAGGAGSDTINGFDGEDTINGGAGADSMVGGAHSDTYFVDNADDVIVELENGGVDTVNASVSYTLAAWVNDLTLTGSANLNGTGNERSNLITGNSGDNRLEGGAGIDTLNGGAGNDTYVGAGYSGSEDQVSDTGGVDTAITTEGTNLHLGAGIENLLVPTTHIVPEGAVDADVTGNELDNVIRIEGHLPGLFIDGGQGNDTLIGGAGFQMYEFSGNYGNDSVDGSAGSSDVLWFGNDSPVVIDFLTGTASGGGSGTVTFIGIEAADGSSHDDWMRADDTRVGLQGLFGNDTLIGGAGDDQLWGGGYEYELPVDFDEGDDQLSGGAGNDTLFGGGGDDTLSGGLGNDFLHGEGAETDSGANTFLFDVAPGASNADLIVGFGVNDAADRLVLDGTVHAGSGPSGRFSAGDARFWSSASGTAHDADDRVIYNTSTGELWYDADGNGGGSAQLIATFQDAPVAAQHGRPELVATHIEIVNGSAAPIVATEGDDSLTGTEGDDTINGLGGNDTLVGNAGDDVLDGGTGDDSMDGGLGNDTYYSSSLMGDVIVDAGGTDTLIVQDTDILFSGTLPDGIENLTLRPVDIFEAWVDGNALDNVIRNESAETAFLDGAEGNDTLIGGTGSDFFTLSAGNDFIDGGGGSFDELFANSAFGAVVIDFRAGTAISAAGTTSFIGIDGAYGSFANDQLIADDSGRSLDGSAGDDTVTGGAGGDSLRGDGGFDHPDTLEGNDLVSGGGGNDFIVGGAGNDTLDGGAGNDTLTGAGDGDDGADRFQFSVAAGSANADFIRDFHSAEDEVVLDGTVHAGSGPSGNFTAGDARFWSSASGAAHDADDRVIYNTSNGQLWYDADGNGSGAAQLIATLEAAPTLAATDIEIINGSAAGQVINGTSGADTLNDTAGNDTINGLAGNDTINGGSGGSDVVNGGDGRDYLQFLAATSGLVADFAAGTVTGGGSGTTSFTNFERFVAGEFNDQISGDASAQSLGGRGGSDTLWGAGGNDSLWGQGGADTFVFREFGAANADTIGDWTSGSEDIALDNAAMTALGADGAFVAGDARFWASSTGAAHDANDRVLFNTSNGGLYYDADGNGSGAAQLIATVQAGATVAATDIVVI